MSKFSNSIIILGGMSASDAIEQAKKKISLDPFAIIKQYVALGSDSDKTSLYYLLDLGSLYKMLKDNILILGVIAIIICLIGMLFASKMQVRAEKKQDLKYKLFIIFLLCSAPTLFTWVKQVCDSFLV